MLSTNKHPAAIDIYLFFNHPKLGSTQVLCTVVRSIGARPYLYWCTTVLVLVYNRICIGVLCV